MNNKIKSKMEKKQSSVEWFYQRILSKDINEVFEQAKAMHKEEIANAWNDGHTEGMEGGYCTTYEEYYNETFGDEKEVL